jgi:hypothetical protein
MRISTALELCLAVAGALGAAVMTKALPPSPSAEETVAKARKALGGDKLAAVKSITATGTYRRTPGPGMRIQMHGGGSSEGPAVITGEREVSLAFPDSYLKSDTINNGMVTLLEGFSGGQGWNDSRSHMGGMVMMRAFGDGSQEAMDRTIKGNLTRYMLIWTLNAPGFTYTSAGVAEAPDGKADVLDGKGPDGFAVRLFLDQETHLPLMMTYRAKVPSGSGQQVRLQAAPGDRPDPAKIKEQLAKMPPPELKDVEMQIRMSEYQKVSGVQLPKVITWSVDGALSEEFEVAKYVVNPPLSPDKFKKGK